MSTPAPRSPEAPRRPAEPRPAGAGDPGPGGTGSRVAWFHCFAGISGDMALGALLDAGADEGELRAALGHLGLEGWSLSTSKVLRGGIEATRVEVRVEEGGRARTLRDVLEIISSAGLPERALARATSAFSRIAEVEGRIHGLDPAEVHFHELGGHDTIVDVAGTAICLELLGVDLVAASPVATGTGTVEGGHGLLPNPSPAVLGLLSGAPLYGRDVAVELTTPTGAAILAGSGARFGPLPAMVPVATGYGAGSREIEGLPNCLQVVVGDAATPWADPGRVSGQPLALVEANVDDATGEEIADAIALLLDAGALDAWSAPVVMKKGRPGQVVSALAEVARLEEVRACLLASTGSLGARSQLVDRYAVERRIETVELDGVPLRLKVAQGWVKVEHDDAAAYGLSHGLPLREVRRRAIEAWRAGSAGA